MRKPTSLLTLLILTSAWACDSPTKNRDVIALEIAPSSASISVDGTVQLQPIVRSNGIVDPTQKVTWTTDSPSIASVDQSGLVTGVNVGSAVVTAKVGGISRTVAVMVGFVSLDITAPVSTLTALGETAQLAAFGITQTGRRMPQSTVQWATSNPLTISVNSSGLVTALRPGDALLTASAGGISKSITVSVSQVVTGLSISGSPTSGVMKAIGASISLAANATDRLGRSIENAVINWATTDATVATIDQTGRLTSRKVGRAEITANASGVTARATIEIATRISVPVDPYLAAPIAGASWQVPVVLLSYFPTKDGINLDVSQSPGFYTLDPVTLEQIEAEVLNINRRRKMGVEQGSRFRAYRNSASLPSLGYRVIANYNIYEPLPASTARDPGNNVTLPDWFKIFRDLGVDTLIRDHGVREVWVAYGSFDASFPSYSPSVHSLEDARLIYESNMSSPTTGDISNSYRVATDLPVYNHTYILYGNNFRRSAAEALHNVGHQLEAMLAYATEKFDGNTNLFWKKFVGQDETGAWITGRAGWTHMPPNTVQNYDYLNTTTVLSDIEDWRPDGNGSRKNVNVNTWGALTFPWPGASDFAQRTEMQWYVYWMQNMPGLANQIPLRSGQMTNWWTFVADWDTAIRNGTGLATVHDGVEISITNDFIGAVLLVPGGTVESGKSISLYTDKTTEVSVRECIPSGCRLDPYMLIPGHRYRVIADPSAPGLTIVEQQSARDERSRR